MTTRPISRRTRRAVVVVPIAVAFTLSGCGFLTGEQTTGSGDDAGACSDVTLRLATIRADDDPTTIGANAFAEGVAEATDGKVTIEVFPNSQLGDANDLFAGMSAGQEVDMFVNGISLYPSLEGAEAFAVLSVPFLWDSYDQMREVLDSDTYQQLMGDAAQTTGVRIAATAGDAEPRALSANRAIETADDMKGLALRIAEAPMPQEFARALDAQPQVVPFADLYLGLQQGVVDAQENGAITMVNQSLMEVQDYFMPTDYIRDVQAWYISDAKWAAMCDEQRAAIETEAETAGELITDEVATQMDEAMTTLEENLEVVDVDVDSFRTALEGVFEKFDGDMWPDGLLEETRQLAEASRR